MCIGYVVCHKSYAKWLRSKGVVLYLVDILDWNGGVGKWSVHKMR